MFKETESFNNETSEMLEGNLEELSMTAVSRALETTEIREAAGADSFSEKLQGAKDFLKNTWEKSKPFLKKAASETAKFAGRFAVGAVGFGMGTACSMAERLLKFGRHAITKKGGGGFVDSFKVGGGNS